MNHGPASHHIAALGIIAVSMASAAVIGAEAGYLAILLVTGALLLFILWDRSPPLPPAIQPALPPATEQDLIETPGFRRIIEGFSDPVLIVERGRVALANRSARALLGNHIVGEDVRLAIRHPAAAEHLAGPDQRDGPARIDIVGLGARNQRWAMQIIPTGESPEMRRLFVHLADESGAYAAERMRGDFVANASHELRTPLAAILGFVETLQDPHAGGDPETRERFLSILENEARRMQQLVDDLMSLSRIEADKYRLPPTQVGLPALVEEVIGSCRQTLGARGRDIVAEISDDVASIQGDRTQISQLLHNLIGNSAKYGRPGTPITVRLTSAPPSMIRLEVADEGEGIPADHLPRLTERFYRVDSGRSRALGGTGLGLAIVKHIVERHRGRLDIASAVGKGTTVSVLLPLAEANLTKIAEEQA